MEEVKPFLLSNLPTRYIDMATVQPIVQPNLFELEGYNTQITYSTTKGVKAQVQTYMTLCLAGTGKQVAF
jgi:hypothetical protein